MTFLNTKKIFTFFCSYLIFIFFIGCSKEVSTELEREEKFELEYGSFENQLNLFNLNSTYTRPDTQICMKDGIFYIANSGGQKILKLSSFGDLLTFFYNPETNIKPSFLKKEKSENNLSNTENKDETSTTKQNSFSDKNYESAEKEKQPAIAENDNFDSKNNKDGESVIGTRRGIEYDFNHPGLLMVTNSKHLFTVDTVADDRIEYDHEENLALRDIILHFDEEGNFIDYIGQEGSSGTPFPSIDGIYSNVKNEVIVVCRTQTSLKIYWYDSTGFLLYKIPIFFDSLPSDYNGNEKIFSSVDKAIPSVDKFQLYVKIDYYCEQKDSATQASLGITYDKSCLYFLNLKTGKYERKVDLDAYEENDTSDGEPRSFKKVYEMIGITENDWCYLSTPTDKGYALEMVDLKSQSRYKKKLAVSEAEMMYNSFNVSADGIISALLASDDKASIVWWRADKIIGTAK